MNAWGAELFERWGRRCARLGAGVLIIGASLLPAMRLYAAESPRLLRAASLVAVLYERRQLQPLWTVSGRPSGAAVAAVRLLCSAADYGLLAEDYGCSDLAQSLRSLRGQAATAASAPPCAAESADAIPGLSAATPAGSCLELRLSAALFAFLTDVHAGRINPNEANFELPRKAELDAASWLTRLAQSSEPASVVAQVEPPFVHYRLLEQALRHYRPLAQEPQLTALPALPRRKLGLGDSYRGAPALRRLLVAQGCLERAEAPDPQRPWQLDAPLIQGLKRFQSLHGLLVDGELGERTYRALTVPFAERVRQIELTLERWRWLPSFQYPTVLVNIPAFHLFAFNSTLDSERNMLRMDVIVGQEYHRTQTPVFAADMKAVVFRPYWDVPRSIVLREILPRLALNASYLEQQHMELVRGETDSSPVVPATAENLQALASGTLRLRQRPGPDNALGLVKFLLPNAHDVYLHDTPAVQLFQRAQRTFSHGCIRVSDPVALAQYALAANSGNWDAAKIRAAMQGEAALRVPLARAVHVLILYGTAVASEDGQLHFFEDIYGQDRRLEALLGLVPVGTGALSREATASRSGSLPAAHPAGIHVHEIRGGIEADAAEAQ